MCLAVPMKVRSINGDLARVDLDGASMDVSIALLETVAPGDFVIVHAGFAIDRLDEAEGEDTLRLFRDIAEAEGAP
jgi:hydrogenase expression/formation protein HypC